MKPIEYLIFGIVVCLLALVVGAVGAQFSELAGWISLGVFAFIGQTMFWIGVIAKGVEVGRRA